MKAIDNSNGYDSYWMTQVDESTWSVDVPKSTYNITFNRYSPDEVTQWNSWSAGGRDENNAYSADGSEYGHWEYFQENEMYFHEGDIIYLDVSEFQDWENDNAVMYINFTDASKEDNGGKDVDISSANSARYNPIKLNSKVETYKYEYIVTKEDAGATALRFWRGNSGTLWNCSISLSYEEYVNGNNCVKIKDWTDYGEKYKYVSEENEISIDIDTSMLKYNKEYDYYVIDKKMEILRGTINNVSSVKNISYLVKDFKGNELKAGDISITDNWMTEDFGLTLGVNTVTVTVKSKQNKTYVSEIKILNSSIDNMNIEVDNNDDDDGDGLINYFELICGTNSLDKDTDNDAVSDYIELIQTETNPLIMDSDNNNVNDGDEDFDLDGLTNIQEIQFNTNIRNADSDYDTILDGDEVDVYKTNPIKKDTDLDRLTDDLEISIGTDPKNEDSDNDGVADSDEWYNIKHSYDGSIETTLDVELSMELKGKNIASITIEPVTNDYFLNEEIPGYIDYAFEFSVNDQFKSAVVIFSFDEKLLEDKNFVPAIYYYNEEEQILEELEEQTVFGNKVSVELEHFSKYLLLNKTEFDAVWNKELKKPSDKDEVYENVDIALIIDSSGSMLDNDKNNVRIDVAKKFVDKLTGSDRAAVIDLDSKAKLLCELTSDKDVLYTAINKINSDGGTELTSAIDLAIQQFTSTLYKDNNAKKYILLLTDGMGDYNSALSEVAKNEKIVINTIGLGESVSETVLVGIADKTGGQYYFADNVGELYGIFDKVVEDADFYKDIDFDGINDYYEKKLNSGELKAGNGMTFVGLGYRKSDSDGDGLIDGDEIIVYEARDGRVYVNVVSNPLAVDGDRDSIQDSADPEPLVNLNKKYEIVSSQSHISKNSSIERLSEAADKTYNSIDFRTHLGNVAHYEWIYTRAVLNVLGGPMVEFYVASSFMKRYLDNTTGIYTFAADRVLATPNGEKNFCNNINELLEICEQSIANQSSLCIATKDGANLIATNYSDEGVAENDAEGKDWWYSIGNSTAAITAYCTNNNGEYTAELHYYIQDFYDWEESSPLRGGLVTDGEMYELHEAGYAREYEVLGSYTTTIVWSKGERFDSTEDIELSASGRRY